MSSTECNTTAVGERKDATGVRHIINCPGCGMQRLLPVGIKAGESFELVVCPKCHSAGPRGRLVLGVVFD